MIYQTIVQDSGNALWLLKIFSPRANLVGVDYAVQTTRLNQQYDVVEGGQITYRINPARLDAVIAGLDAETPLPLIFTESEAC